MFDKEDYYSIVKQFFDMGIYIADNVKIFVLSKDLTEEQYKEITGEDYTE